MPAPPGSEAADAGRFYDVLRASGLSPAALAYGDAYIGQECTLTADEIGAFARRAGIAAGTSVLDIGSGTGGGSHSTITPNAARYPRSSTSASAHGGALPAWRPPRAMSMPSRPPGS